MKWCKSVGARYGNRGVRSGEVRNPGLLKRLRQILASSSQSMNRFEILSSDDELGPPPPPTTVLASSGEVRGVVEAAAVQARRLVIVSQDLPPILKGSIHRRVPSDGPRHQHRSHQIGTPRDSLSDDTGSVGRASEQDPGEVVEDGDMVVQTCDRW